MKSPYIVGPFIALYPQMAVLLGSADRALILQKLADLIEFFEKTGDPDSDHWIQRHEGKTWHRSTYARLHEKYFSWMGFPTFKKHIYWLRDAGYLLLRGGWREERIFRREVWFTIDFEFLNIALSAIESANANIRAKDRIDPIEGSNRSYRRIESILSKDRIDPIDHKPLESSESLDLHHTDSSSSSPRKAPPNGNGLPEGDEESDEAGRLLAIHNGRWVTVIGNDGQIQLVEASTDRLSREYQQVLDSLLGLKVKKVVAADLAARVTVFQVECWKAYLAGRGNIRNRTAYLVSMLASQELPPKSEEQEVWKTSAAAYSRMAQDDGSRFISGPLAGEIDH